MYPDKTGLVLDKKKKINIFKKINIYLSRRSKSNVFAQYNFIDTVAPDNLKKVLKMRFIPQSLHKVIYFLEKKSIH